MLFLLPQAVDRAAERAPEQEALRCSGSALDYGELARRTNRLARVLIEHGVNRGDRVGIYSEKGLDATVGLYGAMKAGGAYVPIDPAAPPRRVEFMLRDCGIRHLIVDGARARALSSVSSDVVLDLVVGAGEDGGRDAAGSGPTLVGPSLSWSDVETAPETPPDPGTMEQDLAYVLYTSGSTGVPKGVMHTHRSALAFAEVAAQTYGFEPSDRLSNHAPLHFDLSTMDYFSSAVAGSTTVIIPPAYAKLPASLSQLIENERLTVLYTVPLALTQLLLHGAIDKRDLSSVRWVLFGGEPFPTKHLRALMRQMPQARFSNVYGPTEVNGVTYWVVPDLPDDSDEPIPIGKTFPNVEALVVDSADEPVAQGEAGELLVRTPTMMMGYWAREDLNEKAFHSRPAFGLYRDRFHRTGDVVRRQSDGDLMFLGRKDRQIKARGHRVELDEVEAVLNAHEDVEAAGVYAVPDESGSQRIEAAVLMRNRNTDASDLLKHAGAVLPPYALPETLHVLEEFPRTSTGKIDRRRLAKMASMNTGDTP